jgi:hypothetical protein
MTSEEEFTEDIVAAVVAATAEEREDGHDYSHTVTIGKVETTLLCKFIMCSIALFCIDIMN